MTRHAVVFRHSWGSMLRTARAPVGVLLLTALALLVPPQTDDMLAFLDDGLGWGTLSFGISLLVLGGSAWFWSRAALAARFGIDDSRRGGPGTPTFDWAAFTWIPRLALFGAFLLGAAMALENLSLWLGVGALVLGVLALVLADRRHALRAALSRSTPAPDLGVPFELVPQFAVSFVQPETRPEPPAEPTPAPRRGMWLRLRALLRHAPNGWIPASLLLLLGFGPLLLGLVEAFVQGLHAPNAFAKLFPGPTVALVLLGVMIGPLTALTFACDGLRLQWTWRQWPIGFRRPPVLTFLLIYVFVLVPNLFYMHTVRILPGPPPPTLRLDAAFAAWADACAPKSGPIQPVIVAISGGATRAGLWGAAVVDQVLQDQQDEGPALFAVSSVSGGSLGAAAAMTLLSREKLPCRAKGLDALRPVAANLVPLAGDALGPLLGGWLLDDIPRAAFDPFAAPFRWLAGRQPNGGDSAQALEEGFTDLWRAVGVPGPGWDDPYLSLFYKDGTYRAGMPLWFSNGTDATTGNRVITSPILAPPDRKSEYPWPFPGARDFHTLMKGDVRISTAINNSARFPYLEPFGEMLPAGSGGGQVGSLVDGGYFENEGLQTALDLAAWLIRQSKPGRPVWPIIVQATGDGEADVSAKDIMTCDNASDGAFVADDKHSAWQILAPVFGLYHVRGGHSALLLREARDDYCPPDTFMPDVPPKTKRFIHFYLPADDGTPVPLNWVLSDGTASFIWHAFTSPQVDNAQELKYLAATLKPPESKPLATQ